jgi:hypothetical protein
MSSSESQFGTIVFVFVFLVVVVNLASKRKLRTTKPRPSWLLVVGPNNRETLWSLSASERELTAGTCWCEM